MADKEGSMSSPSPCRLCGASPLTPILSLGKTPLANALRDEASLEWPEPIYPLDLVFCPRCALVQLLEAIPPEGLFRDYLYFSSYSDTMVRHAAELAGRLTAQRRLGPDSLVIEAASNDGYLLRHYREEGVPVLGVEPAGNVALHARERYGIPTREEFFTAELGRRLAVEGMWADVFHAHNVLAHVPDLNGFVEGIRAVLKPHGVAVIEVPYVKDMLDHCEFDTIYHEHLSYFWLSTLDFCFRRHGLVIADVERLPIHGGSLRVVASPAEAAGRPGPRVEALLAEEKGCGIDTPGPYREFAERVNQIKESLRELLRRLKAGGGRIAAYGASAKGSTLLNYCGIGRDVLDFVVDRSPAKQGRFTPGTGLRIYAPEKLLQDMPDFTLLLTWNFADEILRQQAEYRRRGGRFIVPVPLPRVA
jgi:SAM-dependent methyltransferase